MIYVYIYDIYIHVHTSVICTMTMLVYHPESHTIRLRGGAPAPRQRPRHPGGRPPRIGLQGC